MVRLENLCVRLSGVPVIRGVSLEIAAGELLCVLGPSGCGKTTMLRAIAGFEHVDAGIVEIDGRVVSGPGKLVPPQQRAIGFLFQDFALFPHMTIAANVAYGLQAMAKKARKERVEELLGQIQLSQHAHKYPHMLSGGQQQRVALARALAPRPKLMLLDEPFSDLDTALRARIRDETMSLLKASGITTVMVTHDPGEAMITADRIALMRDGRIVQSGAPMELYKHPVDAFTAAFFGDVNRFDGKVEDGQIHTPLGTFPDSGFSDGTQLAVFIRPEAVSIGMGGNTEHSYSTRLRVCSVKFAGSSNLVRLGLGTSPGHEHLEARLTRPFAGQIGDQVEVQIDKQQTYFFEKDS